jgi:hypothetical protein
VVPFVAVAAQIAVVVASAEVRAQEDRHTGRARPIVVVVSMSECCEAESWPAAEENLRSELLLLDVGVEVASGRAVAEGERRLELERLAREHDAIAALRIIRPGRDTSGGVEIWIADRLTGKTTYRWVETGAGQGAEAATIVAVRAVEALRASMVELRIVGRGPAPVQPPPEAEAIVDAVEIEGEPSTAAVFGVGGGGVVAGGPGGSGVRGGFRLTGLWTPVSVLAIELEGAILPLGAEIEQGGARTELDCAALRGWVLWQILNRGVVRPAIGLGGGVWFGWVRGLEGAGRRTRSDHTAVGYAGATGRLLLAFSSHLGIAGGVQVGLLSPELRVLHGEEVAARLGRPVLEGFLVLDTRFP